MIKRIRIIASILVTVMFLISCNTVKPVQGAALMDDTWYVMTMPYILMLCEADESQKEYIEAIKLLKGDKHSVEVAIEKLETMEQTVEIKNALGIGSICFAKYKEAEEYLNSALELAEKDSQKICILNNQIHVIQFTNGYSWSKSAMDKYDLLIEKKSSDPIQNLVLRSNLGLYDAKINAAEKPVAEAISVLEKLIREEKEILGTNQMVGILNYTRLGSIYIDTEVDIQKGIDYLNKAMKLNEETYQYPVMDIAVFGCLSDAYVLRQEYNHALKYINKREEIGEAFYNEDHPSLLKTYLSKGLTLYKAGRYEEAIASYEKLIRQTDPNSYDAGTVCFNLGLVYYKKDEIEKAVEYFTKSYCIYANYEEQSEDMDDARILLQRMYETGGYSEKNPDFDDWMQEQINQYGADINNGGQTA